MLKNTKGTIGNKIEKTKFDSFLSAYNLNPKVLRLSSPGKMNSLYCYIYWGQGESSPSQND